jgi:hypothetical protein
MKLTTKEIKKIKEATQKQVLEAYMFLHQFVDAETMASTICSAPDRHNNVFEAIEAIEPVFAPAILRTCKSNNVPESIGRKIIQAHRLALRAVFEADKEIKNGVGLN